MGSFAPSPPPQPPVLGSFAQFRTPDLRRDFARTGRYAGNTRPGRLPFRQRWVRSCGPATRPISLLVGAIGSQLSTPPFLPSRLITLIKCEHEAIEPGDLPPLRLWPIAAWMPVINHDRGSRTTRDRSPRLSPSSGLPKRWIPWLDAATGPFIRPFLTEFPKKTSRHLVIVIGPSWPGSLPTIGDAPATVYGAVSGVGRASRPP